MAAPKDATTQSATKSDSKSEAFKSAYEQLLKLSKDTPSNEQQTLLAQFIANHADTFDFKPYAAFVTKDSNTKLFQTFAHSLSANKENYGMVFQFYFLIKLNTYHLPIIRPPFISHRSTDVHSPNHSYTDALQKWS